MLLGRRLLEFYLCWEYQINNGPQPAHTTITLLMRKPPEQIPNIEYRSLGPRWATTSRPPARNPGPTGIHSKSEKVCGAACSVKRKFRKNCPKLPKIWGKFNFFAGSLGSRYSLLECLQFCSTYNFKQSYEGAMHKGTNNSFLCSHWLLHILAKKEETNQGEAQQVLIWGG